MNLLHSLARVLRPNPHRCATLLLVASLNPQFSTCFAQGNLSPPGAPAPTMKTLDQVSPGTALSVFPAIIAAPGHYYLTRNVSTVPGNQAVIRINTNNVTLDLRGFSLISTGGTGTTFSQSAIYVSSSLFGNIVVRNGIVDGNWYAGAFLSGPQCAVEQLLVRGTEEYGIYANGRNSRVSYAQVDGTGSTGFVATAGIWLGDGAVVNHCTVFSCDGRGYDVGVGCSLLDSSALDNTGDGMAALGGSVVSRCVSSANTGAGFSGTRIRVVDCAAYDNDGAGLAVGESSTVQGCLAYLNAGAGISGGDRCAIRDCTTAGNIGAGVSVGDGATIVGSVSSDNDGGGFDGISGCVISQCSAFENRMRGFDLLQSASVTQCAAFDNDDDGFRINIGSVISHCSAYFNGRSAANVQADGFDIAQDVTVVFCNSLDNRGMGIRGTQKEYLDGNHIQSNDSGGIMLNNSLSCVIRNFVDDNSVFDISPAPANGIAPIQVPFSATHPFANFRSF